MDAKIRKNQTTLICSGIAVIAFEFWSIARGMIGIYIDDSVVKEILETGIAEMPVGISYTAFVAIVIATAALFIIADMILRLYVGISAIREGNGKKKGIAYVVWSIVYLLIYACTDIYAVSADLGNMPLDVAITSLIIEFTSCIALYEIIRSSIAIRICKRRMAREGSAEYAA